ncbi:MAG: hypothetical protein VX733_06875 [Candidatus Latescibacterota bacterium]|nr:hypothetical protein [Candidatus Latescibacterota bacterium]
MIPTPRWFLFIAAVAVIVVVVPLARRASQSRHWMARALVQRRFLATLSGLVLAATAPSWISGPGTTVVKVTVVVLAGWLGFAAGCGLDMRVTRRAHRLVFAYEALLAAGCAAFVVVVAFALQPIVPVGLGLEWASLLLVAAACVAASPLPLDAERARSGGRHGHWRPSSLPVLGALLAAVAGGTTPMAEFTLAGEWFNEPVSIEVEGLLDRLLWGVAAGAVTGLLADLILRDDFEVRAAQIQVASVILMLAGFGAALSLEPSLIGSVAGFWLVNATLRRIDVIQVVRRGTALSGVAPFLAAWMLGESLTRGEGVHVPFLIFVLAALLTLRPTVQVGREQLLSRILRARRRVVQEPIAPITLELHDFAIVLAAGVALATPVAVANASLAAVLVAQFVLGAAAKRWESVQNAPADPSASAPTTDGNETATTA